MPSVLQIQKLCFHNLGRAFLLLAITICMVGTLSAAEPTVKPRLRIQPVVKNAQPASIETTTPEIQVTGATAPTALKPVVRAAAMTLFDDIAPPVPEPMPAAAAPAPPEPVPMPLTQAPNSPSDSVSVQPQPLPSIADERGHLTGKPESFFKSLTPEDREILYDGKLANQFGIGRTFEYPTDENNVGLPENIAAKVFSQEPEENFPNGYHRDWYPMVAMWEAPAFYHRPLYFEEVNLERYGHTHKHLQPAYSAAHFFANTLALPYKMGAYPPCERIYTLGHHRPGDCNPHDIHTTPFTWKGVFYTGVVYSGVGAAFP
ncbi:hypothetical protein AB1K70_15640 [Bremerella sp. JC770]|uniref:hypothetical protein n=1 Tax=Bremerella sp. JC770 TaxID=3232137 RepID=UPI00345A2E2C